MKTDKTDKNLIIWIIVILLPIIFTIVAMVVKTAMEDNNHDIKKTTYVHAFYVKGTESDTKLREVLDEIHEPYEVIFHDITEESDLYKKVLDYLEITEKVYNPLIMINNDYFTEEYDKYSLENSIKLSNETYRKNNLSEEDLLKYDVVDRLESKEEVYKSTQ